MSVCGLNTALNRPTAEQRLDETQLTAALRASRRFLSRSGRTRFSSFRYSMTAWGLRLIPSGSRNQRNESRSPAAVAVEQSAQPLAYSL